MRARFWRRRRAACLPPPHRGIRLRISIPEGPLIDADCEHLYYVAKYGGLDEPCGPACPPGCDRHGWYRLANASFGAASMMVDVRAVQVTTLESLGL